MASILLLLRHYIIADYFHYVAIDVAAAAIDIFAIIDAYCHYWLFCH